MKSIFKELMHPGFARQDKPAKAGTPNCSESRLEPVRVLKLTRMPEGVPESALPPWICLHE